MNRLQRSLIAGGGLLAVGLYLFSWDEPPMWWQALAYMFLYFGHANDNGPDTSPLWVKLAYGYGLQTIVLALLLTVAYLWVSAAPASKVQQAD